MTTLPILLRRTLAGVLGLAAIEFALTASGLFDRTKLPDPYMGFPGSAPIYRVEGRGADAVCSLSPNMRARYRAESFPAQKPPGEWRLFFLGGSSVFAEHYTAPEASFAHSLEAYLDSVARGCNPRVINSGGGGTGSVQNLKVAREVLEYQPDVLLLYPEGGEKNLIPPSPGGLLAHGDQKNPLRVVARENLASLRTYIAMRSLLEGLRPKVGQGWVRSAFSGLLQQALAEPFSERTFTRVFEFKKDRRPVLMEHVIPQEEIDYAHARFLNNTRAVVRLAKERGVLPVLVMPQHNLRSSFYMRFHIAPDEIRAGALEEWKRLYDEGLEAKRAGRHEQAIERFSAVRALYPEDVDDILAYYLAECHAALGDFRCELVELTRIYERHPMLHQIRQVAEEEGVLLVDPFPDMIRAANGHAPGDRFFGDSYHPTPEGNRIIARSIAKALIGLDPSGCLDVVGSPSFLAADERILETAGQIEMPMTTTLRVAMAQREYLRAAQIALELSNSMTEDQFYGNPTYPFYLGWALTRAGRLTAAEQIYNKLKERLGEPDANLPDMSTDEGLIRHAFQGDVFAIF